MKASVMNRSRCFCCQLKHKSNFLDLHLRRSNEADVQGQHSERTCCYQTREAKPFYLCIFIVFFLNYTLLEMQKKKKS